MTISAEHRRDHHQWLLELTQIPTAAGCEQRVIEWIKRWCDQRQQLSLESDAAGNMTISLRAAEKGAEPPIYFTAHLDHPAFVVRTMLDPRTAELELRGGVMDPYFPGASIVAHTDQSVPGTITEVLAQGDKPFKCFKAEFDLDGVTEGDFATWHLPPAEITEGILHTNACDDLAALAAALGALDILRLDGCTRDVRVLLTRAEEVGFIGAIRACKLGTIPRDARLIALENSRSFPDSPIRGGPIVRVGDRMSIFSPSLTGAVAKRAEEIAGGPAQPLATQKSSDLPTWRWQRKLMAGGACEATVYCAYDHEATCVCLPLGNYHNMADLDAVQAGTFEGTPRVGREYISVSDFDNLVDLLIGCGNGLPDVGTMLDRLDRLDARTGFVLEPPLPS